MLGEKLLDRFSEYDLRMVDETFTLLSGLCIELHEFERGSENGGKELASKWSQLSEASESLDYIFFED